MIVVSILCGYSCLNILAHHRSEKEVYFITRSGSLTDQFIIQLLTWLGWRFIPLEYELKPLKEKMPLLDIRQDLDDFFNNYIAPKIKRQVLRNSYFSEYEKKRVEVFLEFLSKIELYRSIEILHLLQILEEEIGNPRSVLLTSSQWSEELTILFKKKGYDVNFYSLLFPCKLRQRDNYGMDSLVIQSQKSNASFLFKVMYLFSELMDDILGCVYFGLYRCLKSSVPHQIGKFDIAAQVSGYGRTEWFNDLFWKRELKGQNSRTLAILFGSLEKSAYDTYGYLAESWITLNKVNYSPNIFSIFYWMWPLYPKVLIRNLTKLLKSFMGTKAKFYYWFEIIKLCIETSKMETLFTTTNIKVFWTSIEGQELTSLAGALAINRLNGISIGSTWSMTGFSEFLNYYKNTVDVFFIWGNRHLDVHRKEMCKTFVISGYPGDFYFKNFVDRAIYLRAIWQENYDARTIICCFDNIFRNDNQYFTSLVCDYFKNLIQWIEEHSNKLLVIKSKHGLNRWPASVLKNLQLLENQRKVIYEFKKADLAPGFASDLVISPGISTLACLLGAYGKDVILLDVNGINNRTPLDLENIKYIYKPEDIKSSLESWFSKRCNSVNDKKIDIEPKPSRLDSFVDGYASKRISGYISSLLSELEKGLTSDSAIHNANRDYSNRWGPDKVREIE